MGRRGDWKDGRRIRAREGGRWREGLWEWECGEKWRGKERRRMKATGR